MSKSKAIFITATDTGVGKTMISGLLLRFLRQQAIKAGYQKWASTGDVENPADLLASLKMADLEPEPTLLDRQVPYRFAFPASPHLAAELEQKEIDPGIIVSAESFSKQMAWLSGKFRCLDLQSFTDRLTGGRPFEEFLIEVLCS